MSAPLTQQHFAEAWRAAPIPCTIRQLHVFVEAAEDCHFGRTAGRLGVSQPAVTKMIASLERQVGKRLFIRKRGVTPTLSVDGEIFLAQVRKFLTEGGAISAYCAARDGRMDTAAIHIASGAHIFNDYIKPWLPRYLRDNPGIEVRCSAVDAPAQGFEMLKDGSADIFVTATTCPRVSGFSHDVLRSVRLGLYGGRAFADHQGSSISQLAQLPFVLPAEGTEGDRLVHSALSSAGLVRPTLALRSQHYDVLRQLVIDGCGVSVLFETMAEAHVRAGELFEFDIQLPVLKRVLYRRDEAGSEAFVAVETTLRALLQ